MSRAGLGVAFLAGTVLLAYSLNQRGYLTIPEDEVNSVPERKAKEICLGYDEALLHNIDSLVNNGLSVKEAVKKGHTITWDEVSSHMPSDAKNYNPEDWVRLKEARDQLDASMKVVPLGRSIVPYYREDYPEKLAKQIMEKRKELKMSSAGHIMPAKMFENTGR